MVSAAPKILTNTWVKASWDEFIAIADNPNHPNGLEKAKFYYDRGQMRIEDTTTGAPHGFNHFFLSSVLSLYGTLKNIDFQPFNNTTFRKSGERNCQPDLALYVNKTLPDIFADDSPINVDTHGAPDLAIEVSASTLHDDLGAKRLLYERLDAREYWIVDVDAASIIAFSIAEEGSRRIQTSQVLPGLEMSKIEEALRRAKAENITAANRWLMKQFA